MFETIYFLHIIFISFSFSFNYVRYVKYYVFIWVPWQPALLLLTQSMKDGFCACARELFVSVNLLFGYKDDRGVLCPLPKGAEAHPDAERSRITPDTPFGAQLFHSEKSRGLFWRQLHFVDNFWTQCINQHTFQITQSFL